MSMLDDYISLNDLISRDLNIKSENARGKYQLQAKENCDYAKIINFEKEIPDICIFEYDIDDFKCTLISYSLTDEDLENNRLKMIGFIIKNKDGFVIGLLDLIFISNGNTKINSNMIGTFNVILTNISGEKKVIKSMDNYVGNGNVIQMMIELLSDCLENIIEDN